MSGYLYVVLAIVFVTLLFSTIFIGVRMLVGETKDLIKSRPSTPMDELETRLAKGEIDRVEFERIKQEIEGSADENPRKKNEGGDHGLWLPPGARK